MMIYICVSIERRMSKEIDLLNERKKTNVQDDLFCRSIDKDKCLEKQITFNQKTIFFLSIHFVEVQNGPHISFRNIE
jgi:hypothetical protein